MLSAKIRQHQSKQPLSEKVGRVRRLRFCTQDIDVGGQKHPLEHFAEDHHFPGTCLGAEGREDTRGTPESPGTHSGP